jgi:hypothetical protein
MARIPKTGIEADLGDAAPGLTETLLRAFDSLQQHIPVRSASRARPEEFGKVVRADAGNRSKLRDAQIRRQVVSNIVEHSFETILAGCAPRGSTEMDTVCNRHPVLHERIVAAKLRASTIIGEDLHEIGLLGRYRDESASTVDVSRLVNRAREYPTLSKKRHYTP